MYQVLCFLISVSQQGLEAVALAAVTQLGFRPDLTQFKDLARFSKYVELKIYR